MKLLVLSDSHGREHLIRRVLLMHPKADALLFLGDGISDFLNLSDLLSGKTFLPVKGNNDWASTAPLSQEITFEQVKLFLTHGHAYHVKYGLDSLIRAARNCGAQIVCFGHTHQPLDTYQDGLHIFNPGSICYSGTYGQIDLLPGGILTSIGLLSQ